MSTNAVDIKRLDASAVGFESALQGMLNRSLLGNPEVNAIVADILSAVRERGDEAVVEYSNHFDRREAKSIDELTVSREQMATSLARLPQVQADALRGAADRIRDYHERQKAGSWQYEDADGSIYGQKVSPLARVGIYVPGGKANYPSSMLMNAIPAQVAGVKEIIATVPTAWTESGDLIFAAAALAGVDKIYTVGGAQAVAALAYGTQSIARVDKITGPGNIFVTIAKKMVFGDVGIDMIAGPSEFDVIADGSTDPDGVPWTCSRKRSMTNKRSRSSSVTMPSI